MLGKDDKLPHITKEVLPTFESELGEGEMDPAQIEQCKTAFLVTYKQQIVEGA